jgi:hypothetical protein
MRPQRPATGRARSTSVERRHRLAATHIFIQPGRPGQGHARLRGEAQTPRARGGKGGHLVDGALHAARAEQGFPAGGDGQVEVEPESHASS